MKKILLLFFLAILISFISPNSTNAMYGGELNFEVTDSSVPVYEMRGGELKQIASFSQGTVWKRLKSSGSYHIVYTGSKTLYIPFLGTKASEQSPTSLTMSGKARFPMTIIAKQDVPFFTSTGIQLGTISKGQSMPLINLKNGQGVISFFGIESFVDLSQFQHTNLLNPKRNLSATEISYTVQVIAALYPDFTELQKIGASVEGRPIYALRVGNGQKEVLFDASMHAREHLTTNVLMEMIDTYTANYSKNSTYAGYKVRDTLDRTAIWFVPQMNPDGITLVQWGPKALKNSTQLIKMNGGSMNFARWKANGRGVDLNENFDAQWSKIKTTKPSYQKYKGTAPFSEPEAKALKDFIMAHNFKTYVSYHTSGQTLYWFQYQSASQKTRDLTLAKRLSNLTSYSVMKPLYIVGSGASADWFIDTKKMPGITVEIAPFVGEKPVPVKYFDAIWKQNYKVGLFVAADAAKR